MEASAIHAERSKSSLQNRVSLESVMNAFSFAAAVAAVAAVLGWREDALARQSADLQPARRPDPGNDVASLDARGISDVGLGPGEWEPRPSRRGPAEPGGRAAGAFGSSLPLIW